MADKYATKERLKAAHDALFPHDHAAYRHEHASPDCEVPETDCCLCRAARLIQIAMERD